MEGWEISKTSLEGEHVFIHLGLTIQHKLWLISLYILIMYVCVRVYPLWLPHLYFRHLSISSNTEPTTSFSVGVLVWAWWKVGHISSVSSRVLVILYHWQWIHCRLLFSFFFFLMLLMILQMWRWLCPVLTWQFKPNKLQLGCHIMCEHLGCCSYLLIYWELTHRQASAFSSLFWSVKSRLLFRFVSWWHISVFHKS